MGESAELLLLKNWIRVHAGKNREGNVLGQGNSVFKGPEAGKSSIKELSKGQCGWSTHTGGEWVEAMGERWVGTRPGLHWKCKI